MLKTISTLFAGIVVGIAITIGTYAFGKDYRTETKASQGLKYPVSATLYRLV